eukprot:COSAG05_NODE_810_length_7182_cov_5.572780_3_plen_481_part_00
MPRNSNRRGQRGGNRNGNNNGGGGNAFSGGNGSNNPFAVSNSAGDAFGGGGNSCGSGGGNAFGSRSGGNAFGGNRGGKQCKFGTSCTRADCHFEHPAGFVPGSGNTFGGGGNSGGFGSGATGFGRQNAASGGGNSGNQGGSRKQTSITPQNVKDDWSSPFQGNGDSKNKQLGCSYPNNWQLTAYSGEVKAPGCWLCGDLSPEELAMAYRLAADAASQQQIRSAYISLGQAAEAQRAEVLRTPSNIIDLPGSNRWQMQGIDAEWQGIVGAAATSGAARAASGGVAATPSVGVMGGVAAPTAGVGSGGLGMVPGGSQFANGGQLGSSTPFGTQQAAPSLFQQQQQQPPPPPPQQPLQPAAMGTQGGTPFGGGLAGASSDAGIFSAATGPAAASASVGGFAASSASSAFFGHSSPTQLAGQPPPPQHQPPPQPPPPPVPVQAAAAAPLARGVALSDADTAAQWAAASFEAGKIPEVAPPPSVC